MKEGIIEKVVEGLAESTRAVHEINKENFAAVKTDAKENNPQFDEFLHTKGIGNKAKLVAENIKSGAAQTAEQTRERRAETQSHENYRVMLEEQRAARQATINRTEKP